VITREKEEMLKFYNTGLAAYKQRKWDDAISAFEQALRAVPKDGPSALYLDRARACKLNPPPEDWDGVFTMTTK
jgi:adenylate cyclase